jgi:hypothetical protein
MFSLLKAGTKKVINDNLKFVSVLYARDATMMKFFIEAQYEQTKNYGTHREYNGIKIR